MSLLYVSSSLIPFLEDGLDELSAIDYVEVPDAFFANKSSKNVNCLFNNTFSALNAALSNFNLLFSLHVALSLSSIET
jgi:hypothetical protein